jgi:hypothetical protein
MSAEAPTSARLRHDIDSGKTGDKAAASDPAMAPLGTDSEAGGSSPTPGEIAQAHALETRRADAKAPNAASSAKTPAGGQSRGLPISPAMLTLLAALVLLAALAGWLALGG